MLLLTRTELGLLRLPPVGTLEETPTELTFGPQGTVVVAAEFAFMAGHSLHCPDYPHILQGAPGDTIRVKPWKVAGGWLKARVPSTREVAEEVVA